MIICITAGKQKNKSKAFFNFFEAAPPHLQKQRLYVDKEHYNGAIVVRMRTNKFMVGTDTILACIFTKKAEVQSCKMVKFKRINTSMNIYEVAKSMPLIPHPKGIDEQFLNCFLIEDCKVFLATNHRGIFLSQDFQEIKQFEFNEIDACAKYVTTFRVDASTKSSNGYLVAFAVNPMVKVKPGTQVYEGNNMTMTRCWTWLTRCTLDP